MTDHRSYTRNLVAKRKESLKKNSGLNGIRTHDLCDTSAVLYQFSCQANWELVIVWIRYIPVIYFFSQLSCVYNCDDQSFIHCFFRSSNIWIFIYSLSSLHLSGYITNSHNDQLPVGLIAQLVEHCTGIAEVMGSNPVQAWIFFRLSFRN